MVLVSPGMLPPTISTTPNSPTVCAIVITSAETMPGQASGSSMRHNVRCQDNPQHSAACRTSTGMDSKARSIGISANGRLKISDPTRSPSNENASGDPVRRS